MGKNKMEVVGLITANTEINTITENEQSKNTKHL